MEGFDDDDDDSDLMEGFDDDDEDIDEGFYAPVNKSTMITNYKPEGFYGYSRPASRGTLLGEGK
jgi:hypothetical protein